MGFPSPQQFQLNVAKVDGEAPRENPVEDACLLELFLPEVVLFEIMCWGLKLVAPGCLCGSY